MKLTIQLIISALVGFVAVTLMLKIEWMDFSAYTDIIVIGLYTLILTLLGWSYIKHRQIKRINQRVFEGEEEDEVEQIKYKKFIDYALFVQSSSVISVLALCLALLHMESITLIVLGFVISVVSFSGSFFMNNLMQLVYSDRNIPKISDPQYAEKLLESSDEGEKHVILNGLYRSHNLLSTLLIIGIVASTIYSIVSENSQIFSIVVMSIILLVTNGKYSLSVRNK